MGLLKLKGVVQNYAWGGSTYIPELIGSEKADAKSAEYWMGAHDNAPAVIEGSNEALNIFINQDPESALGSEVYKRFGRLPYLFKVLDVADMLSIQVHPSKTEAEKGFAAENMAGIPLNAPNRNYKDDNHKPEIMVAHGEFWLLHGFKKASELVDTLKRTAELSHLIPVFEQFGYKGLYQTVMEETTEQTNHVLAPLIDRVLPLYERGELDKSNPDFWAARAYKTFCAGKDVDKGIYSIYFFNIVRVNAGEAVFQDAGVPHAYMEGQNMELMANSDNVLRGGLTPKHVDVDELLKHTVFEETIPNILQGEELSDRMERVYSSPAPDFELSKINLTNEANYDHTTKTFETLIVLDGEVIAESGDDQLLLKKGEVLGVTAHTTYSIRTSHEAILYKAKCPI